MSSAFPPAFAAFNERVQEFMRSSSFETKTREYKAMLEQSKTALPQQRELYLHSSPEFVETVDKSISILERIVSIHDELEQIFRMDEKELGMFCAHDLKKAEHIIAQGLQEVAALLYQFEKVVQQGKNIIEVIEDPFLTQGS